MKIALIYNKPDESTTGAYIEKVFQQARINYQHFWTERAGEIPKDFDLYFRIDHGDYKYDLPKSLHPAVFYVIDTHLKKPFKKIKRQAQHYDIVFCAQKNAVQKLRNAVKVDAQWIPLGCDPEIHKKIDSEKKYDIGFVGRNAENFDRGEQLKFLKTKFPKSFIGSMDFREMNKVYCSSKIGFNSSIVNDINMRMFEVLSCGCFLLTNKIRKNGFEDLFEDGKHLVVYQNNKDLVNLADYYIVSRILLTFIERGNLNLPCLILSIKRIASVCNSLDSGTS